MEARLRKLLPSRRTKSSPANNLPDIQSIPYGSATPPPKLPVPLHEAFSTLDVETLPQVGAQGSAIQCLPYDAVPAGKAPTFGLRPHKGNGPVKLQTSRRLSSGEHLVTTQDSQRTLEDIREGDYIVAGKPESRVQSRALSRAQSRCQSSAAVRWTADGLLPPTLSLSPIVLHTSPHYDVSPRSPNFPWSPSPFSAPSIETHSPSMSRVPSTNYHQDHFDNYRNDLPSPRHIPAMTLRPQASTATLLEPHEEQNATIQALWKAEYNRLVSVYGQAGVDRNIAELNRDSSNGPLSSPGQGPPESHLLLEPLRRPSYEMNDDHFTRRSSGTSHLSTTHHDSSDESTYKRLSNQSSSYTGRTSVSDLQNTRSDLRKVIQDMRKTYLTAIESESSLPGGGLKQPPGLPPHKQAKKSKSTNHLGSPIHESPRHKSWSSSTSSTTTSSISASSSRRHQRHRSATSQPHNKLPVILASPSPATPRKHSNVVAIDTPPDSGIKRADSTTLGSFLGESKRAALASRHRTQGQAEHQNHSSSSTPTTDPNTPVAHRRQNPSSYNHNHNPPPSDPDTLSPLPLPQTPTRAPRHRPRHSASQPTLRQFQPQSQSTTLVTPPPPSSSTTTTLSPSSADDFDILYHDLFGTPASKLWMSSPSTPGFDSPDGDGDDDFGTPTCQARPRPKDLGFSDIMGAPIYA